MINRIFCTYNNYTNIHSLKVYNVGWWTLCSCEPSWKILCFFTGIVSGDLNMLIVVAMSLQTQAVIVLIVVVRNW